MKKEIKCERSSYIAVTVDKRAYKNNRRIVRKIIVRG